MTADPASILPRFAKLPWDCGERLSPGVDEVEEWQDFSARETTDDQLRIEDVIRSGKLGAGGALLHIGVGNSGLAQRFQGTFRTIRGITIQAGELRLAESLGIAGYSVKLFNKYSDGLAGLFPERFDVIVDNNPTSFCCCRRHLMTMMANYAAALREGGVILTDRKGLRWTTIPNVAGWGMSVQEWFQLGALSGLRPVTYSDSVAGLASASA